MSKKRASEATVSAFIKAVYPEFTELAIASNGEEEILRDATAELTRLRALAARAEDLEGMASVIFGHMFPDRDGWDAETDERLKECYRSNARAVAAYLKGEK